jgi:hypothetical protein
LHLLCGAWVGCWMVSAVSVLTLTSSRFLDYIFSPYVGLAGPWSLSWISSFSNRRSSNPWGFLPSRGLGEGDWISNELHRKCTSWLSSVSLTQAWSEVHRSSVYWWCNVRWSSTCLYRGSLLFLLVDVGDGCFSLCMWCCWGGVCTLFLVFSCFVTLGSWLNNVTTIVSFCRNLW